MSVEIGRLRYVRCQGDNGTCHAIYPRGTDAELAPECGTAPLQTQPWHPKEHRPIVTKTELIAEFARWLEEIGQHQAEDGRLYGMFVDAMGIIAEAYPDAQQWWMETEEVDHE